MSRVVLQKTLADNLRSNEHVIVTTNNMDGDNVTWPKVDRNSDVLTNSSNRIPSSKVVSEISAEVDSLDVDFGVLRQNLTNLQTSAYILSSGLSSITDGATGKLEKLSADIEYLSSGISALFNHKAVRFIGVSETDPASGIVTIDGNRYVVSTDFNTTNNGNIVYYKKTIANHVQCDGHSDQHEPVDAITMMYAYIYANGVWNDSGHIAVNDGQFHKFGYSFYQNLSTLIHDDMVCDYANIKITKISGLQQALNTNTNDHRYLSGKIDEINNNLNNYQLKTSAEISARNLTSRIDFTNERIDQLSGKLSIYLPKTVRVQTLNNPNDTTIPTTYAVNQALTEINNSILTTRTDLTSRIQLSADDLLGKLQLSVHNILNILSATLRPEVNSVNKHNQTINNYTW